MNIRHKFRVWDEDESKWRTGCSLDQDGTIVSDWGKEKSHWKCEFLAAVVGNESKELYEGDIIKFYHNGKNFIGIINTNTYWNGFCVFYNDDGYCACIPDPLQETNLAFDTPELIGNIHEHSHLVEGFILDWYKEYYE